MVVSFDSSAPSASLKLSFFMGTPRGPSGGGSRELAEAGEILSPRLRLLLNRADISGAEKGVDFDQSKECGGGQSMRVCVSRTEKPVGVPYFRPADDPKSHSYVDLKEHPEKISLIPEIRD